jgi:hypothetical protein
MTIPFSVFWLIIGLTSDMSVNQRKSSKFGEFMSTMCGFQTKLSKKFTKTFGKRFVILMFWMKVSGKVVATV